MITVFLTLRIIMLPSVLLLVALLSGLIFTLKSDHWATDELKPFCSWKCLKLTLQWPGGFCVGIKNTSDCRVPQNIQNWTIHGLWPSQAQNCCRCWPIFHSDVKELDPELSQFWPSLLKISNFNFWKNEWIKHGTCAACVEGMNSPKLYFQISLKLRRHFDIDRVLETAGIQPSCIHSYQLEDVHTALAPLLGDIHEVQCVQDEKGREVWVQVKIPLSQNLTLGCFKQDQDQEAEPTQLSHTSPGHPCPKQSPIFYFPINHDSPHQPCD